MRGCWNTVDIYHQQARCYKVLAKVLYALLLGVGIAITFLIAVGLNKPEAIDDDTIQQVVLGLSVVGSLFASMVAFSTQHIAGSSYAVQHWLWKVRFGNLD